MASRPEIRWWKTDLGDLEIRGLEDAIRGRHINRGPICQELERQLADVLDVPHVVLTTSGSAGLLLSLLACGVGPGDEVIMPAQSFVAGAHAAMMLGAGVKLVDVLPDRPLMDPAQIEAAITDRTRVIMPVHLNGMACDMAAINAVAGRRGLKVVEDAAQSFASACRDGALGTLADLGAFSMGITKLITTGEGGFVATRNTETYTKLLKLRNHGVLAIADNVFDGFGFNLRFNDVLAAVGLAQMRRLPAKIAALKENYACYSRELAGLPFLRMLEVRLADGELPLWTQVLCAERQKVIALLSEQGIETKPFHPVLADSKHLKAAGDFPCSRFYAACGLILPSGPDQGMENLRRTVQALRDAAGAVKTSMDSVFAKAVRFGPGR
jgi:dTDP-4-amino-4,6-dideoxygalactose transaminase